MKHLIVGCGVVGEATGTFLETNKEDVWYCDKKQSLIKTSSKQKWVLSLHPKSISSFEILWICTPETAIEDVLKQLSLNFRAQKFIIVRSTTIPGTLTKLEKKYKVRYLVHNPEFLKESTAINDTFNPDRIVIGSSCSFASGCVLNIYKTIKCKKFEVSLTESELIKQISNAWLATQISFWNEIKELCDKLKVNPQEVANAVTRDKRISEYGSIMLGKAFGGHCLPKDLEHLIECFKEQNLNSYVLHMVRNYNDMLRYKNEINR